MGTVIISSLLAVMFILAVRSITRDMKKGGCGCGCSGCSGCSNMAGQSCSCQSMQVPQNQT